MANQLYSGFIRGSIMLRISKFHLRWFINSCLCMFFFQNLHREDFNAYKSADLVDSISGILPLNPYTQDILVNAQTGKRVDSRKQLWTLIRHKDPYQ
ncbi:hypothetical protein QML37_30760, partial [Klebsiella pneumoniae]|uniref:hypothetical protein n=1 Tax=Klebsiella pneumoniae TaxID=573 RepID=UPI003A7FD4B7